MNRPPHGPVDINDIVALQEAYDRIYHNHIWYYPNGTKEEIDKARAQFRLDRSIIALLQKKIEYQMAQPAPPPLIPPTDEEITVNALRRLGYRTE